MNNKTLPFSSGVHDIKFLDHNEIRFTVSIPEEANYPSTAPNPLILILHYGGEPFPFYGRPLIEQLYLPNWNELGAIMVAPESFGGAWSEPENETRAIQLFQTILDAYKCDARKTLVTGYSAGAIGAHYYALNYPELFTAAIPIAGYPSHYIDLPVPARFLLSKDDELFPLKKFKDFFPESESVLSPETVSVKVRSHYDVANYGEAVRECITWIRSQWNV